jgi:GTP1/Obg family GTP-binding protein
MATIIGVIGSSFRETMNNMLEEHRQSETLRSVYRKYMESGGRATEEKKLREALACYKTAHRYAEMLNYSYRASSRGMVALLHSSYRIDKTLKSLGKECRHKGR